jgi:hypothetical protein
MHDALATLHDATLREVRVDWTARTCEMAFNGSPAMGAPFSLRFRDLRRLLVPLGEGWGSSGSVLEAAACGSEVRITMQTGDVIELTASRWECVIGESAP